MHNLTEIVPGQPLHRWLNAREVRKYSDFGPVEGYISDTVQDTASGTWVIGTRRIQLYHSGASRVTPNKGAQILGHHLYLELMDL